MRKLKTAGYWLFLFTLRDQKTVEVRKQGSSLAEILTSAWLIQD